MSLYVEVTLYPGWGGSCAGLVQRFVPVWCKASSYWFENMERIFSPRWRFEGFRTLGARRKTRCKKDNEENIGRQSG